MTKRTTRLIETSLGKIKDGWKPSINRYTGETELKPSTLSSGKLSCMLRELHCEDLRYNELGLVAELGFSKHGQITGADADHLYVHLGAKGWSIPKRDAIDGLLDAAMHHPYHPVKEFFETLRDSDHIEPIDLNSVATDFLGVPEEDTLSNQMLRVCLIGAVARAMKPGVKHDTCCVLQGLQGARKSSFWAALCREEEWFNDTAQPADKDFLMALHACFIYEAAELDSITTKKQAGALKALISSRQDSFRPPYGSKIERHKRSGIMVGTVNREDFLVDDTGNRRFHVIPIPKNYKIDVNKVNAELYGIWRAAVLAYLNDEPHWLTEEEEAESEKRNDQYKEHLLYESRLLAWLRGELPAYQWDGHPFSGDDALHFSGSKDRSSIERRHQIECSKALVSLGFERKQKRVGGHVVWLWFPTDKVSHETCNKITTYKALEKTKK